MPETTKQVRRRGKQATDQAEDAQSQATDQAEDAQSQVEDATPDTGGDETDSAPKEDGRTPTVTGELKDAVREAAIEVLRPVMRKATTSAAKYAVTQGPTLVKDKVAPKLQDMDL